MMDYNIYGNKELGCFMKIIVNDRIYIQKKDLELIFKTTNKEELPNNIIEKYKENIEIKDISFIAFEDKKEIDFLNEFWFVVNYRDIIDFDQLESVAYYFKDLQNLRKMRVEHDKNKCLPDGKIYDDLLDAYVAQLNYFFYLPNEEEVKNYHLEFQLLYNKFKDAKEIDYFKMGVSKLELPEEVFRPVRYSKKQLQQIYYGVLSENLTFEELKPYEKQLYCIFSRINYTPDILDIIRKIMIINRNNTVDFINDELLDIILRIEGKDTKFEQRTMFLIDYLYAIGYNKFENFDSKPILEKDLKIIKTVIDYITRVNLEDRYIDKLSNYNSLLAEITRTFKKCNYSLNESKFVKDVFCNMAVFVYFRPKTINYDYKFLEYVYDYLKNNSTELIKSMGYEMDRFDIIDEHFVDNFNRANNLLLSLYNEKYNKDNKKNSRFIK